MGIIRTVKSQGIAYVVYLVLCLWPNMGKGGIDELEVHVRWLLEANHKVAIFVNYMQTGMMDEKATKFAIYAGDDFFEILSRQNDFLARFAGSDNVFFFDVNHYALGSIDKGKVTHSTPGKSPPETESIEMKEVVEIYGNTFDLLLTTMQSHYASHFFCWKNRDPGRWELFPSTERDSSLSKLSDQLAILKAEKIEHVVLIGSDIKGQMRALARTLISTGLSVITDKNLIVHVGLESLSFFSKEKSLGAQIQEIKQENAQEWESLHERYKNKLTLTHKLPTLREACIQ